MSQQINLLPPRDGAMGAILWALAGLAVMVMGLAVWLQSAAADTARLRETESASRQQLEKVRAAVLELQKQRGKQVDATALVAEIAALRPRAEAVSQLVREVRSGTLGSPQGFARYYAALGNVTEEGLWITGVSVTKGGTAMTVSGRALRNEAVMRYAQRLNDTFGPHGLHFNSLDLTPEALAAPGAPAGAAPALTVVAFRLS